MKYEIAYGKWYIKHNKKLFVTYLIILAGLLLVPMAFHPYSMKSGDPPLLGSCYLVYLCNLFMAVVLPLYQFRYLMNKRSVDLYFPLPIKKQRLFLLDYGFGAGLLLLPNLLFFLTVAWERAAHPYLGSYVVLLGIVALLALSLYSAVTFFVVKCNTMWDALFAAGAVLASQVLIVVSITSLLDNITMQVLTGNGSAQEFFPIAYLESMTPLIAGFLWIQDWCNAFISFILKGKAFWNSWFSQSTLCFGILLYYAVISIAFSCGACRTYMQRKGEAGEQKTTSKWIYPLFILLITCSLIVNNLLNAGYFWFTVVVFFLMNFLAERKITVRPKMIALLIVFILTVAGFAQIMLSTEGFGKIHNFYQEEEIHAVRIDISYFQYDEKDDISDSVYMDEYIADEELINRVVQQHKRMVDMDSSAAYGVLSVNYELNNGNYAYRNVYFSEQELKDIKDLQAYLIKHKYAELANRK